MNSGRRINIVGPGLLVGLVAALLMTLTMLVLRYFFGIATPAELNGDRIAPFIPVDFFFKLLGLVGGFNTLKQLGIGNVILGQLVVGALGGWLYAVIVERERAHDPTQYRSMGIGRRGMVVVTLMAGLAWIVSLGLLWPVLGTHYQGLPPGKAAIATASGLLLSYAAYGAALVGLYRFISDEPPARPAPITSHGIGRRALFVGGAGIVSAIAVAVLFRQLYRLAVYGYDGKEYKGADLQPITPNDRFYVVTKNNIDPHVVKDWWRLEITGQVEHSRTYRLEEIIALPSVEQETTLQCISNAIGGGLMSNAIWKGVPLRALIEAAGPKAGVMEIICRSVDGYTDDLPLEKAMDPTTLVAYEMNGVPLPQNHGFPARILAPGYVGEKSVKWVTRIELHNGDTKQFYERQGWGPNFILHTHSRIDVPDFKEPLPLGSLIVLKGVAFAGNRGVDRVEISFDDGRTWQDTELTYKNSRLAWVHWKSFWQPREAGEYKLVVRATDGAGTVQTSKTQNIAPEGATGYHRVTARILA